MKIIDIDLYCGAWPFGWSGGCTPSELSAGLDRLNIQKGLACSLESVFNENNIDLNGRFIEKMKTCRKIRPLLSINPSVPSWKEALEIFKGSYSGLKLLHRFHGYSLLDPSIEEFFKAAEKISMPVVAGLRLFEERTQPFILKQLPEPDIEEMTEIPDRYPGINFIFSSPNLKEAEKLLSSEKENLYITSAFIEGEDMLPEIGDAQAEKIIFGSNFPFFYLEAAIAKIQCLGCSEASKERVFSGNAEMLFKL